MKMACNRACLVDRCAARLSMRKCFVVFRSNNFINTLIQFSSKLRVLNCLLQILTPVLDTCCFGFFKFSFDINIVY